MRSFAYEVKKFLFPPDRQDGIGVARKLLETIFPQRADYVRRKAFGRGLSVKINYIPTVEIQPY